MQKKSFSTAGIVIVASLLITLVVACSSKPKETGRQLSWKETGSSLALMHGETVVWQFNHLRDGSTQGCAFFHPLATLDGAVLTDLRPEDHLWHRGLRFAWKKINGLEGYWTWPDGDERFAGKVMGHTDVVSVKVFPKKDFSARFELEISYHPPDEPALLTEKRTVSVSPPDKEGSYFIDWQGTFTPAGKEPVVLDRTPILGEPDGKAWGGYAGLQLRVAHSSHLNAWSILTSEGVDISHKVDDPKPEQKESLARGHSKPARWLNLTLDFSDGKTGGVTLMDHPGNLRYPSPWHISSMPNELIYAPLFEGPYTLQPGESLFFHLGIRVHPGPVAASQLDQQWEAFTGE
ncbi:MAG: PmoA family protein [Verrucomicrobiae bacterium]|nr:PmoA family protein [Verrucomicrobiae bacterium]